MIPICDTREYKGSWGSRWHFCYIAVQWPLIDATPSSFKLLDATKELIKPSWCYPVYWWRKWCSQLQSQWLHENALQAWCYAVQAFCAILSLLLKYSLLTNQEWDKISCWPAGLLVQKFTHPPQVLLANRTTNFQCLLVTLCILHLL